MDILKKIFNSIRKFKSLSGLKIEKILLSSPFSVVKLNDGSIGSAINYDNLLNLIPQHQNKLKEKQFYSKLEKDPLLWNSLVDKEDLLSTSLKVSILSSLSQDMLNSEVLSKCKINFKRVSYLESEESGYPYVIPSLMKNTESILIIGEGGVYPYYVLKRKIPKIVVCDLRYKNHDKLKKTKREAELLIRNFKYKGDLSFIDTQNLGETEIFFDTLWITGSTLCNDTLGGLTPLFKKPEIVVLQGPSCSVFPKILFELGITDILTTIKSEKEVELGKFKSERIYEFVDRNYVYISK